MDRETAARRVERLVETVESETMPVPVREVWVFGEATLGLDPIERLDVYLTKDLLLGSDVEAEVPPALADVDGVGETVRASWAAEHPELVRTDEGGHVAPARCLAAHLLDDDEPVHLEVCNASFGDNVTRRAEGAVASGNYEQVLDPRGACLWIDGERSEEAFQKLRDGEFVLPTLPEALEMLGLDGEAAERAARAVEDYRDRQSGATVRGDVV